MGMHTWFEKDKVLFLEQRKLYDKIDSHEREEVYLDESELNQLWHRVHEISELNDADYHYHDLFRTSKRNEDGTYTDDVIFSKKECFTWLEANKDFVSFKNTVFDTDEQEIENKKRSIKKLNEFWEKYPDGVIYFG